MGVLKDPAQRTAEMKGILGRPLNRNRLVENLQLPTVSMTIPYNTSSFGSLA